METYLNGRVSLSSLSAPTEADLEVLAALSDEDRKALLDEALAAGEASGIGTRSVEDIFEAARQRARAMKPSEHAL